MKAEQYDIDKTMALAVLRFWQRYGDVADKFEHRGARIMADLIQGDAKLRDKFIADYCAATAATRQSNDSVVLSRENFKHLRGW